MNQQAITAFNTEESTDTSDTKKELEPWPEEIPDELQRSYLPPIRSDESVFTEEERENGNKPNVCFGDLDCYRTEHGELFGFLLLTRTNSDIYTYVVHNNCYTTYSPDHFNEVPKDITGDITCSDQRKIYKSVVEPPQK